MKGYLNRFYGGKKAFLRHLYFNFLGCLGIYSDFRKPIITSGCRLTFVCSGNICRSALSDVYARMNALSNKVDSIGLDTVDGKSADRRFSEKAKELGIDMSLHSSKRVESYKWEESDIFICMEPWQALKLVELYPKSKVTLLGLWLKRSRYYLHDPYASCEPYAEQCVKYLVEATDNLIKSIQ